jgi:heat shock protein HslJ
MVTSIRFLVGIVVASAVLAACGGSLFGGGSDDTIEGSWSITMIKVLDEMVAPAEESSPYLNVTTDGLNGNTGCNGFFGEVAYESDGGWSSGPLASTEMACIPVLMAQETAIIKHIQDADTWSVDGDVASLSVDSEITLELVRLDSDLAGTEWEVTGVNNGNQALQSVISGTELTLIFGDEGQLSGSSGCNTYGADYAAGDTVIQIGAVVTTLIFCESPAGVMDQEAQFTTALSNAASYTVDGSTLTIRDADGSMQVTANKK